MQQKHGGITVNIFLNILLLVAGFAALIKGADFFVDGSAALARTFKVPGVIIGLTIVAMGTSAPELAVSTSAAIEGSNEIAISNVTGSNIFNLLMILGISTSIHPIRLEPTFIFDTIFLVAASLIILLFAHTKGKISRKEGLIMLALYIVYDVYIIMR